MNWSVLVAVHMENETSDVQPKYQGPLQLFSPPFLMTSTTKQMRPNGRGGAVANGNAGCCCWYCCRPWYSFTATYPKDIVVMVDKSSSMLTTYLTSHESKLTVAIRAAQAVIDSLNPNDNVCTPVFLLSRHR